MSREQKAQVAWLSAAAAFAAILGGLMTAAISYGAQGQDVSTLKDWVREHRAESTAISQRLNAIDGRLSRIEGRIDAQR